jgi:hypothetical protein
MKITHGNVKLGPVMGCLGWAADDRTGLGCSTYNCLGRCKSVIFLYFLFQFANLYDRFEIYQKYTSTVVAYGG